MNNLTFIQKIKYFISNHKTWSLLIVLVIIIGSYFIFKSKTNTETRYTTSSVSKGNIVISVSGSGQVEPSNTININANASGIVDYVGVKVGQTVKKGTLIASVDSRDAKIALETAQLSLDILKQPNTLTVLQNENAIKSAYDSSWNNVSSFVLDMQTVTSGLGDLYNSSGYLGYKNQMLLNQIGKDKIDLSYKAYWDAKNNLDATIKLYKSLSRTSSTAEIDNLISNSLDTSREISNAIKLSQASLDDTANFFNDMTSSSYKNTQTSLITWTSNVNSYTNSILLNISTNSENSQSLKNALTPADELSIRQANLNVETKQNAYDDCFMRAPFDGIIASLTAEVGQTASGTIGTLITKQKLITISLNEVDIPKIKIGQKATLTFAAIDGLHTTGSVVEIDSVGTVSQGVVTYNVSISLDVDDARVKPGMSVTATIITNTAQDVVIVPNSAVKTQNGVSYVETFNAPLAPSMSGVQGSTSTKLPNQIQVGVGLIGDTSTEITSGLKEGDIIVTKTIVATVAKATTTPSILNAVGGNNRNQGSGALRGAVMGR